MAGLTTFAGLTAALDRLGLAGERPHPAGEPGQSAAEAGAAWVALGLLTPFQLEAVLAGRGEGLRVGSYVLLDRLGSGGMGEVFRARHVRLGHEVALKVIRQDRVESATASGRFLRELRGMARVSHPNVVRVYNAGRDARHFYFSMEYVRGPSLAELVRRGGPLSVADACRAAADGALGLAAVHAAGLVHRDIKPENLVREAATGRTKVLDLGLAGLAARQLNDSDAATLTRTGIVLGTPDTMAPEQALDPRAAGPRSDLYSLGCTLAFLLTGRPVFPDGSAVEKLFRHVYAPPPDLRAGRPDAPPELAEIVARLLAKSPGDRYPSATAVADALRPFAGGGAEPAAEPFAFADPAAEEFELEEVGPPSRWRWRVAAGGVLAVVATVVLAFAVAGRPVGTRSASDPAAAAPGSACPEDKLAALKSALGKPGADVPKLRAELYALHAECRNGPLGVAAAQALRAAPSPLDDLPLLEGGRDRPPLVARRVPPGPRHWGPAHAVAVSPDGETVATAGADRLVRLWSARTGGPLRTLAGFDDPVYDVTFSPDGKRVAASSRLISTNDAEGFERKSRVWDVATGELLLTAGGGGDDRAVSWRYGPAGDTALAGAYDCLQVRSATDGKVLRSLAGKGGTNWVVKAEFSRDGGHALAAAGDFRVHVWNLATGEEVRAWKASDWHFDGFDRSPTADTVLTVADGRIRVWDWTTGAKLAEHEFAPAPVRAAFSPDGRRLLAGCSDGGLRVIDAAAGKPGDPAPGHDGPVQGVAWAPGGRRAFSVGRDGTLRRWDAGGERPVELDPPPAARPATALAFTDDDRSVVVARPGQPPEVWKIGDSAPADTGTGPPGEAGPVAISPDGKRVAGAAGGATVRVWPLPTGSAKDLEVGPAAALAWLPDSRRLLLARRDQPELLVIDAATGRVGGRLPAAGPVGGPLAVSPDGKWVAGALQNGDIAWWDVAAGKPAGGSPRPRPQSVAAALAFAPAGRTLRAFGDGWGVTDLPLDPAGQGRQVWDAGPAVACGGAVSFDGTTTVVAAKTGEVALLPGTGNRVRDWKLPGRVTSLAFATNGRYLAAAHADGSVGVYRVP